MGGSESFHGGFLSLAAPVLHFATAKTREKAAKNRRFKCKIPASKDAGIRENHKGLLLDDHAHLDQCPRHRADGGAARAVEGPLGNVKPHHDLVVGLVFQVCVSQD